jgi:predicted ATPase
LVQGLPPDSDYRFKHTLIQDAAYENLLKSRRQVMHRHVAEILRDRFADTAAAEPEVLAHHFTQAGMTDEAIEWWGKAGDQALHRSAFQEAIFHLSKAIEMADKEGDRARTAKGFLPTPKFAEIEEAQALSETDEVKKVVAARQRRLKLQVSLANALLQSRGQHSSETKLAFDKARELASGIDDPLQRFSTYYGVWVGGYVRGERATMIEAAEALMKEADARPGPDSAEKSIANRIYGVTCWMARDDLTTARTCLEKAVAFYRPERDRELAHRFAQDIGVSARAYLSLVLFVLGESDQARAVMADAMSLAAETKHAPTLIYAYYHAAFLEMLRLDPVRAKCAAETCLALAREHGVETWTLLAPPIVAWANADWDEMRRSLADCRERDIWLAAGTGRSLLAAGQAAAGQLGSALATADEAIAEAEQRGLRFFEAETHHIRGEILLKRDPANTAPVEEAFLSAIAIAQQQRVRSFELRAALSLAKLYQSTRRAADAHAILAPVLAGFSPTPEFPEIAEARELLATL